MLAVEKNSGDVKRREKERVMVQEGVALWNQEKARKRLDKIEDQKRSQAMLSNYHPWGRPGGGAPNPGSLRRKASNVHYLETLKGIGNNTIPRTGGHPPVFRRSDPQLRYQFHEPVRRSVDDHIRYRKSFQDQLIYKQQLDSLVREKKRIMAEQNRQDDNVHRTILMLETPWGRPGPGGSSWRDPRTIGFNFLHSLGWTGEPAFRRLEHQHNIQEEHKHHTPSYPMILDAQQGQRTKDFHPSEELITGGVELVPLLARRRAANKRYFLPSTDVTRIQDKGQPNTPRPTYRPILNEREYLQELTNQVINKEMRRQESKQDDLMKSRRHFETWGGFWGRPGHGAPKGIVVKENLNNLLFHQMPVH